jgi:two-component system, LytTR family, response regulator
VTLRALVVDDEPVARRRLCRLLRGEPGFTVAGECGDGVEAAASIKSLRPDLVLLDVEMPGMNGFQVVESVGAARMPPVVFVTAFDRYAVQAFELHAVDYLLKPVTAERFGRALTRVRSRLEAPERDELTRRLAALLAELQRDGTAAADRFYVRDGERGFFVRLDDIDWVEASRNYVRLHVGSRAHAVRGTLKAVERRLDRVRFRRISRSALVNLDRIKELQPWFHGDGIVILQSGKRLVLSRRYRDALIGPR